MQWSVKEKKVINNF